MKGLILVLALSLFACAEEEPASGTDTSGGTDSTQGTDTSVADSTSGTDTTTTTDTAPADTGPPTACTSNGDCKATEYCDFTADFCGATGFMGGDGECAPRPEVCDAGGTGACACDGATPLNDCEAASAGQDISRFGGCTNGTNTFDCGGLETCSSSQFCAISMNDTPGPEYFAGCNDLPTGCASAPSCDCLPANEFDTCNDSTGYIVVVYPGG